MLAIAAREEAARGQDGGRRQHDAGSQRGHEEHRAPRHGRGLEAVRHAADARGRRDRAGRTSRPTRRSAASTRSGRTRRSRNDEWVSQHRSREPHHADEGRPTHLAYKAEHVVDLKSDLVLAAEIYPADHADTQTLVDSVVEAARSTCKQAGSEIEIEEVAADKGYHAASDARAGRRPRTCGRTFPSRSSTHRSRVDRQAGGVSTGRVRQPAPDGARARASVAAAAERTCANGRFAHVCDTGGMRRSWLRGLAERDQALPDRGRGAQPGPDPAEAVRGRQAEGAARPLPTLFGLCSLSHWRCGRWPRTWCARCAPSDATAARSPAAQSNARTKGLRKRTVKDHEHAVHFSP